MMLGRGWMALLLVLCAARVGTGAIRFELPQIVAIGNGVSATAGFFDVLVRADPGDLPQPVGSFNVDFHTASPSVQFGTPQQPPNPLFSGSPVNFSPNPQTVRAAKDVFPSSAPLFDGAGLVRVPFQVAAGVTGVFQLSFGSINELTDAMASPLNLQTTDTGSITVPIPGDYNVNGSVGPEDYNLWREFFGSTSNLAADGNQNGKVDAADYVVWRDHVGQSFGAALADSQTLSPTSSVFFVPEPNPLFLAICGIFLWELLCRRRGLNTPQRPTPQTQI